MIKTYLNQANNRNKNNQQMLIQTLQQYSTTLMFNSTKSLYKSSNVIRHCYSMSCISFYCLFLVSTFRWINVIFCTNIAAVAWGLTVANCFIWLLPITQDCRHCFDWISRAWHIVLMIKIMGERRPNIFFYKYIIPIKWCLCEKLDMTQKHCM